MRVKVVRGRTAKGRTGTVFWVGEDRYKEGSQRLGLKADDDGETFWVSADNVELAEGQAEVGPEPELAKGDRVRFSVEGQPRDGAVVWLGPSKHGGGTRVGVAADDGERLWFDARMLTKLDGPAPDAAEPPPAPPTTPDGRPLPEAWSDDDPAF